MPAFVFSDPAFEFAGGYFELAVPFFAELADERFFEEAVEGRSCFAACEGGGLADVPPVVVDGAARGVLGDADGVELAGDGLGDVGFAFAPGFFDGAEAAAFGIAAGEDAVAPVDDGGDEVAVLVAVAYALAADDVSGFGGEVVPDGGEQGFELCGFAGFEGGACVAFDAALALACVEVAAELFFQEVEGDDGVLDLQHGCVGFVEKACSRRGGQAFVFRLVRLSLG